MKLNKYNMSHRHNTGFRTGQLHVTMMQDVTPGEIWYGSTTSLCRMDPLNKPAFMSYGIHRRKFFVPYRILDDNFTDYWTGQNPSYTLPTIDIGNSGGHALDANFLLMFGLIFNVNRASQEVTDYPIRAYNAIWNAHFRPEDVAEANLTDLAIQKVYHSQKSYFGQVRDSVQMGSEVSIDVSGGSLNMTDVRDGMTLQRLRENQKIYGDRYIDRLRSYGCKIPYGLIDEPVPVSYSKGTMGISEVVETANTGSEGGFPGQMAGHGIVMFKDTMKPRKFSEPGILMEVAYARPPLSLNRKIDRIWKKHEESEGNAFYNPETALQSDNVVMSDEVYSLSPSNTNYGYVDNYEWLRSAQDGFGSLALNDNYLEYNCFRDLDAVPTLTLLRQVDDYDYLFQEGTSTSRADVLMTNYHKLKKYSPVRKRGRS